MTTLPMERAAAPEPRWQVLRGANVGDRLCRGALTVLALSLPLLLVALVSELALNAWPAIRRFGLHFVWTSVWDPVAGVFGAAPMIFGTIASSFLALLLAVPLSLGVAIYLTEFAPKWLRQPVSFLVELLAAIPSVVYGLWGIFVLIPFLRTYVVPPLRAALGWTPFLSGVFYGNSLLAGGVILAIMIVPYIAAVSREVLLAVPATQREAALGVGATRGGAAGAAVGPSGRAGREPRPVNARRLRRRLVSGLMTTLVGMLSFVAVLALALILGYLVAKGASSLDWSFFVKNPVPAGQAGGGVANAIIGTVIIVGLAALIGLPIGIGTGLYLAEYGSGRLGWVVRFVADVLNGTPSIVVGIFAWTWLVKPMGHFSALAGSVALAVLMVPMLARTTEEMVRLVPHSLREAALALGYPRWRTSLRVIARTALAGIVTGCLVGIARVAGETAPLLFTALGNLNFSTSAVKSSGAVSPAT